MRVPSEITASHAGREITTVRTSQEGATLQVPWTDILLEVTHRGATIVCGALPGNHVDSPIAVDFSEGEFGTCRGVVTVGQAGNITKPE